MSMTSAPRAYGLIITLRSIDINNGRGTNGIDWNVRIYFVLIILWHYGLGNAALAFGICEGTLLLGAIRKNTLNYIIQ